MASQPPSPDEFPIDTPIDDPIPSPVDVPPGAPSDPVWSGVIQREIISL
jgi:hypothetical protein